MNNLDLFPYTYIDNKKDATIFFFHGTGGTKDDFLFFDQLLEKSYNIVGLQGTVKESGMNRFFKRLSEGVFDQNSIRDEAEKLNIFISSLIKVHKLKLDTSFFIGYSNGANMLLALLFLYPSVLKKLILLRPMLPFKPEPANLNLKDITIYLHHGNNDSMVSSEQQNELNEVLEDLNAHVISKLYSTGHQLSKTEIDEIVNILR